MKKFGKTLFLLLVVAAMTGCVKQTIHMDINKNGDVTMTAINATQNGTTSDSDKEELEKLGYKVEDYEEDDLTGIKFSKTYKLSEISSKESKQVDLTTVGTEEFDKQLSFQKKGNTYKANFIFDTTLSDDYDESYASYASDMEISYSVTLPNKPKSHNADTVSEDGKTLTWNVKYGEKKVINYEFKLGSDILKYVLIGGAIVVIAVVIVVVVKKNKKQNPTGMNNAMAYATPMPAVPNQGMPQTPVMPEPTAPVSPEPVAPITPEPVAPVTPEPLQNPEPMNATDTPVTEETSTTPEENVSQNSNQNE